MTRENKDFTEIYDLSAIRVQVDSVRDCYGVLGVVHSLWKPVPGRFKDYVAMPKSNGYQSLHTTVITHTGEPIEIQIRTHEMHRIAEFGVAAHWTYKEGTGPTGQSASKGGAKFDERFGWLRLLMEWQNEVGDAESFLDTVKVDLFQDEVYVFTPKGDVLNLPADSSPVDFAYRIHTEVGHRCIGAKVNGRMVPLDYELQNGEIVEVLTTRSPHGPSRDWLNFVKSASAKERIRKWFKSQRREENVAKGRDLLDKELHRMHRLGLAQIPEGKLDEIAHQYKYGTADDFLAAVGYGELSPHAVIMKMALVPGDDGDELKSIPLIPQVEPTARVLVRGARGVFTTVASCCQPVPGDAIVGYTTRGKGRHRPPLGLHQRRQRGREATDRAGRLGRRGHPPLSGRDQDRGLGPAGSAARHRHGGRGVEGQHERGQGGRLRRQVGRRLDHRRDRLALPALAPDGEAGARPRRAHGGPRGRVTL